MHFGCPTLHESEMRLLVLHRNLLRAVRHEGCDRAVLKSFERKNGARLNRAAFVLRRMHPVVLQNFHEMFLEFA